MDDHRSAQGDVQVAPLTLGEIAQVLLAYIGIPAALLYPVGFVAFVFQIWMFYPFNFSTAWCATSLIPIAVVTGQGVKVLLVPLVTAAVISLSFGHVLIMGYGEAFRQPFVADRNAPRPRWLTMFIDQMMVLCRQVSATTLSILIVVMILFATLLIPLSFVTFNEAPETAGLIYWVFFALVATPFVVIGGEFILYDYHRRPPTKDDKQPKPATRSAG